MTTPLPAWAQTKTVITPLATFEAHWCIADWNGIVFWPDGAAAVHPGFTTSDEALNWAAQYQIGVRNGAF